MGAKIERVKRATRNVRKYGVPHEETVILPAMATVFFVHQYEIGSISVSLAAFAPAFVSLICGFWLGLAWKGFPVVRAGLRTWYISIIATLLMALGNHPDVNNSNFVTVFAQIEKTFGLIFYLGWFFGGSARDLILDIYSSPKQREIAKRRQERFRLWFRIALETEDEKSVHPTDRLIGRAIRNVLTNPAQLLACVTAVVAFVTLLHHVTAWMLGQN
jgi:hypothetical protein